ncbi:MAG: hypothetical protein QMD21_06995 [Candidatus Thermoplasmatota archaeon]|nr:hypothetical protein [Candidatus Thermoplasmatota archaeon]MDI6887574.1 hypothetical protein [Candidatus Thermoplasmatota archaeon]
MTRKEIAKKAAIAYFGLSSSTKSFPEGVQLNIYESCGTNAKREGFLAELANYIEKIWEENIGSLSRTARLSEADFLYYVNKLRTERGASSLTLRSLLIERWMKNLVDLYEELVLAEVVKNSERKLLLVNTKMSL